MFEDAPLFADLAPRVLLLGSAEWCRLTADCCRTLAPGLPLAADADPLAAMFGAAVTTLRLVVVQPELLGHYGPPLLANWRRLVPRARLLALAGSPDAHAAALRRELARAAHDSAAG